MTDLIADASTSTMLLFPEPLSPRAIALFRDAQRLGHRMVAPHILPVEVTNAIRRNMRRARLPLAVAQATLDDFLLLPIDLEGDDDPHRQALRLTAAHSLRAHDAHYVALAERLACDFWTADERLLRAVAGRLPFARHIRDYQSPPGL